MSYHQQMANPANSWALPTQQLSPQFYKLNMTFWSVGISWLKCVPSQLPCTPYLLKEQERPCCSVSSAQQWQNQWVISHWIISTFFSKTWPHGSYTAPWKLPWTNLTLSRPKPVQYPKSKFYMASSLMPIQLFVQPRGENSIFSLALYTLSTW